MHGSCREKVMLGSVYTMARLSIRPVRRQSGNGAGFSEYNNNCLFWSSSLQGQSASAEGERLLPVWLLRLRGRGSRRVSIEIRSRPLSVCLSAEVRIRIDLCGPFSIRCRCGPGHMSHGGYCQLSQFFDRLCNRGMY